MLVNAAKKPILAKAQLSARRDICNCFGHAHPCYTSHCYDYYLFQAFPRKGYAIERVIEKKAAEGLRITAQVVPWESMGTVAETILKNLNERILEFERAC